MREREEQQSRPPDAMGDGNRENGRERADRFRVLFESMTQGVVYQEQDGRIVMANPAAERILGVTIDQMQGRTSLDPRWRAIREDGSDYPGERHPSMEALRTGIAQHGCIMGVFHPGQNEYRWILVDAVPEFRPGERKPYQVYTTFTDITDRKRAAEDLVRRTHALSTVLDVSRALASTLDVEKVLQAATDGVTRLFGLDTAAVYLLEGDTLRLGSATPPLSPGFPEELHNAPLSDHPHIGRAISSGAPLFVPDLLAVKLTAAERAVTEQRGLRTVLYVPLIAGTNPVGVFIAGTVGKTRDFLEADIQLSRTLANLAALAVENSLLYASGLRYVSDLEKQIADRKKAEQERLELERQLLHAQKLESLGVLAGGIAHDFNNLLMAVLGNLDLALANLPPGSASRPFIEQSAQAARRATDLTRQMLAYTGKGRYVVKALDLTHLAEENAHLFRSSVARTITLDLRLARTLPAIEADAGQIQQVIMNLLTNASEAIGDQEGRITLTTCERTYDERYLKRSLIENVPPAGRFVTLEVFDTGCGMDEATRKRIFEPFFSTKATGRGLGMSAILGIVQGHRGAIFVDSEANQGTMIRILFPVLEGAQAEQVESTIAPTREGKAPAVRGAVLIADDEEIVRKVCAEMVRSLGLRVLTASDGKEAVERFRENPNGIGCVILDLTMPNMGGMAAFQELVRIRPDVKVVLCSGFNEHDSVQRLSGHGFACFLQKPYSLETLREVLEKVSAGRSF